MHARKQSLGWRRGRRWAYMPCRRAERSRGLAAPLHVPRPRVWRSPERAMSCSIWTVSPQISVHDAGLPNAALALAEWDCTPVGDVSHVAPWHEEPARPELHANAISDLKPFWNHNPLSPPHQSESDVGVVVRVHYQQQRVSARLIHFLLLHCLQVCSPCLRFAFAL